MRLLLNGVKVICLGFLLVLVVVLAVNVLMRYGFGSPFYWAEEAGQLLLVWLSFLGAALAGAERRHMRTELLDKYVRGRTQRLREAATSVLSLMCLAVVVFYGVELTIENLTLQSESLNVPYAIFYGAIPIGCILYMVFEAGHLLGVVRSRGFVPEESADAATSGELED